MDPVGMTSRWVAAARARESDRLDRLFDDPLAAALAGPEGFAWLDDMERAQPWGRLGGGGDPTRPERSELRAVALPGGASSDAGRPSALPR